MNCKAGDMAMIVRGVSDRDMGKTVTCIELATDADGPFLPSVGPVWRIDREITWFRGCCARHGVRLLLRLCSDECLMPIRPDDSVEVDTPTEVETC